MKQIRIILSMVIAFCCFTGANAQSVKRLADTVVYQCPMKCEGDKTYDKAGKCPTCNMNLKAITKPVAVVYQCPMKCEGDKTYDKAGKCPTCNMNLKAISKPVAALYQCPMKCEGEKTYDKAGKCPKCNMNLSKVEIKKEAKGHEGHNHN